MSPRESATEEEEAAAEYLRAELEALGYEVETQPFTFERMAPERSLRLPDGETMIGIPMRMSGLGTVSGPLVHVGLAKEEDIPDEGLAGRIALIRRGEILFEEKVSRVAEAGASAAVIYNNAPRLFAGGWENQASIRHIPVGDDGEELLDMMSAGTLEITISLEERDLLLPQPDRRASGGLRQRPRDGRRRPLRHHSEYPGRKRQRVRRRLAHLHRPRAG